MEKGQILGIRGISLFFLSLAFFVFNQAYATNTEDPFPPTLPPQPNYSVNLGTACTDNEINPPNNPPPTAGDGLCNSWETSSGLKISFGGQTYKYNCVGFGGTDPVCPSPTRKDIYVEYDWFNGHQPNAQALTNVISAFNKMGITLHLESGSDSTFHRMNVDVTNPPQQPMAGNQTPPNTGSEFNDIKRYFFGTPGDRVNANYLTAKRQAFHYAVFGHFIENNNTLSGRAEMPGNDMFIAMSSFGSSPTINQTAGTLMHELGHNLGLDHGGPSPITGSNIDCKPNYVSVMSSSRMTPDLLNSIGLGYAWTLNYSNTQSNLNEGSLIEGQNLGLQGKPIIHGNNLGTTMGVMASPDGIDWDNSGLPPLGTQIMDANKIPSIGCINSGDAIYTAPDDWNNLNFKFRVGSGLSASWGDGVQVGKYKDIFQKNQVKSKEAEIKIPEKFNIYRDKEFKGVKGTISITKSPRAQLAADIPAGQVTCEQSHEFIYVNRTKDSTGTPLCIKTIHFGKFLELFKEFIFFDNYICDINFSIGEYGLDASIIDNYKNSKTGQPLNCSEYVKQYQ